MKKTNLIFWTVTGLFSAGMLLSAIPEIMQTQQANDIMNQLGYPAYINPLLGVLKILGIVVILVPGFPILKEWAYAGFFFDLLGATYSGIAKGGFDPKIILFMGGYFLLLGISYNYSRKRTRLAASPSAAKPAV
jgi:hypothetical protein